MQSAVLCLKSSLVSGKAIYECILTLLLLSSRILLYGVGLIADTIHKLRRLVWPAVLGQASSQPSSPHFCYVALYADWHWRWWPESGRVQRPGDFHPWGHSAVGGAAAGAGYPHHSRPVPFQHQLPAVGDPGRAPRSGEVPVHCCPLEEKLRQQLEQSSQPHFQLAWHQCATAR